VYDDIAQNDTDGYDVLMAKCLDIVLGTVHLFALVAKKYIGKTIAIDCDVCI
jgi:hypothetical protein